MIGRWFREARLGAVVALVALAVVLPSATAGAALHAYDMPTVVRVDVHRHHTDEARTGHLGDVPWPPSPHERSASPPARAYGPSTPFALRSVATNSVDDLFQAPATSVNRHGQLTNGTYTIDAAGMAPHQTGSLAGGKSQWWSGVDAETATLDAASYADANGLWVGSKAKIPVTNGTVGVVGRTGEPTQWINVYRNKNGFVHGAPGGAG
jgi:hypothetical protein